MEQRIIEWKRQKGMIAVSLLRSTGIDPSPHSHLLRLHRSRRTTKPNRRRSIISTSTRSEIHQEGFNRHHVILAMLCGWISGGPDSVEDRARRTARVQEPRLPRLSHPPAFLHSHIQFQVCSPRNFDGAHIDRQQYCRGNGHTARKRHH